LSYRYGQIAIADLVISIFEFVQITVLVLSIFADLTVSPSFQKTARVIVTQRKPANIKKFLSGSFPGKVTAAGARPKGPQREARKTEGRG